jgi:hypothetical protein
MEWQNFRQAKGQNVQSFTQEFSIGDFRGKISLMGEIKGFRILMGRIFCDGEGWRALLSFALHLFKKKNV